MVINQDELKILQMTKQKFKPIKKEVVSSKPEARGGDNNPCKTER